ncbi:AAA family ATPase [Campylobacter ureolyticus]|uniref:AAA family ATPase n=1 Tax=Campylobacter ureolyticus TaxID=827 RepID=UPI0022B5AA9F|nr:AAA family ATPase [Campylobacter ureolyticus]MCZ6156555.1 AAA family ATPase [Campylobacter ureolyticus]
MQDKNKNYWLIPSDPEFFNAIEELKKNKIVSWSSPLNGFKIGDIVYIYLAKPVQSIKIKTKIVKINDDKEFELELIHMLDTEKLNLNNLQKHGLKSAQPKQQIQNELLEYILKVDQDEQINKEKLKMTIQPLNQILYGPPGTGKTYNTIKKAIEIIEGNIDNNEDRDELKKRFDNYIENGQIKFITFHQNYSYEEFIEGLKAESDENNNIKYEIKDGVFKDICEKAKNIKIESKKNYLFNSSPNIWKMSLGNSQLEKENYVFDYCIKNSVVLLGFGENKDFSDCNDERSISKKLNIENGYPIKAIDIFKNKMQKGDLVLISYGNLKLRAIARVVGEYKLIDDDSLDSFVQAREVEWLLIPNEPFPYDKFLINRFSQFTIYNIKDNVKIDELKNILSDKPKIESKNYVLIIDEINRGNISKIFGELITLIEPSKRIGAKDAITVELPYSKNKFGVPSNLYIIGTMNTADRSIALMDVALRRRFNFIEMMPDYSLLKDIKIDDIEIATMLKAINERIECLYDRDHMIGHAYFLGIKSIEELSDVFRNRIIPLLCEYFYDDWEKIRLILADDKKDEDCQFVKEKDINLEELFSGDLEDVVEKKLYEINSDAFKNPQSYIEIYPKSKTEENDEQIDSNS